MSNDDAKQISRSRPRGSGGLRDSQKRKRLERILNVASELFRRKSFEDTTVEEIAENAEVSSGTVFNYYGSKVNILLSLIEIENTKILEAAVRPRAKGRAASDTDVCKLLARIATESLKLVTPAAWRHVYSTLITDGESEFATRFRVLQDELVELIAAVLADLPRPRGTRLTYDPLVLARCIHRVHTAAFIDLVSSRNPDIKSYQADIKLHVGDILRLLTKSK